MYETKSALLRRQNCPVQCGFYAQLCCDSNELCYTDASNEAQCKATAPPSTATQTVVSVQTAVTSVVSRLSFTTIVSQTSLVTTTLNVTQPSGSAQYRPSLVTSIYTSLYVMTSIPPTQTSSSSSTPSANSTAVQRLAMSGKEKAEIGGGVSAGGVIILAIVFFALWKRHLRRRPLRMNSPARISNTRLRDAFPASAQPPLPDLTPKQPPMNAGRNPYDISPADEELLAAAASGSPPSYSSNAFQASRSNTLMAEVPSRSQSGLYHGSQTMRPPAEYGDIPEPPFAARHFRKPVNRRS